MLLLLIVKAFLLFTQLLHHLSQFIFSHPITNLGQRLSASALLLFEELILIFQFFLKKVNSLVGIFFLPPLFFIFHLVLSHSCFGLGVTASKVHLGQPLVRLALSLNLIKLLSQAALSLSRVILDGIDQLVFFLNESS